MSLFQRLQIWNQNVDRACSLEGLWGKCVPGLSVDLWMATFKYLCIPMSMHFPLKRSPAMFDMANVLCHDLTFTNYIFQWFNFQMKSDSGMSGIKALIHEFPGWHDSTEDKCVTRSNSQKWWYILRCDSNFNFSWKRSHADYLLLLPR